MILDGYRITIESDSCYQIILLFTVKKEDVRSRYRAIRRNENSFYRKKTRKISFSEDWG